MEPPKHSWNAIFARGYNRCSFAMQKRAREANVSDLEMLRTVAATFMGAKAWDKT